MAHGYCPTGDHYPDELVADSGEEVEALVYGDGTPTNRYADGVVGLSEDAAARAAEDESPVCPDHRCEVIWQH